MWNYFAAGNQPAFEGGVVTELIDDDGSGESDRLFERTLVSPVAGSAR